jgi:hypothetical protein
MQTSGPSSLYEAYRGSVFQERFHWREASRPCNAKLQTILKFNEISIDKWMRTTIWAFKTKNHFERVKVSNAKGNVPWSLCYHKTELNSQMVLGKRRDDHDDRRRV